MIALQIPALGKHYSQRWAQEDLLEEQREGARANDKKKSMMGPLSELDAKGNSPVKDRILTYWEKCFVVFNFISVWYTCFYVCMRCMLNSWFLLFM